MQNQIIEWAREQCAVWEHSIELMEKRQMTTGAMRDGIQVDTTQETIDDRKRRLDSLRTLIATHEAKNA